MSITVTATQTNGANGMVLRVFVLTGAAKASVQTGGSANAQITGPTFTASITTTAGSNVYGGSSHSGSADAATGSNATIVDDVTDGANNERYVTFKSLNVTGGATARGYTAGTSADIGPLALFEILASGTLTEDGSGPAGVSTTSATTVTTASFTPPPGSLLVAIVGSDGGGGVTTMAITDTYPGGLNWTEKVKNNPSGGDYAGVWIADVPAGGGAVTIASDAWFNIYKRMRKPKPESPESPAPVPSVTPPTLIPYPAYPRRVAVPAMARRRVQIPIPVSAPVVAQPVFSAIRVRPRSLQPQRRQARMVPLVTPIESWPQIRRPQVPAVRRRPQTMPLRLQVSGPPPALPQIGTRARWAELRRRPRASFPPPLQVSGPVLPPARPARRFVGYPAVRPRRHLALSVPVPFASRRLTVTLPRFGRRNTQLAPPVVVIVQPFTQQQPLPRKAMWFGLRLKRTQQAAPPGAAPPPVAAYPPISRTPRRLAGTPRKQQGAIVPAQPLPRGPKPRSVVGFRLRRVTGFARGAQAPPARQPARTRIAAPRPQPKAQFAQPPVLAKPPPMSQRGSRARLVDFLRRLRRLILPIPGAPPAQNFPGFVTITNRQMEPVVLANVAAGVAITDRAIGTVVISNVSGAVTITNKKVGMVTVSNL